MSKVTYEAAKLAQVAEILSQWNDGLITEKEAARTIYELVVLWDLSR